MEQLWKDYMAFEQNINPIIAEKMGMERSRDYMNARRVAKELEAVTRGLNRSAPSVPPTGHPEEIKQVILFYSMLFIHSFNYPFSTFNKCESQCTLYLTNCFLGGIMEEIYRVGTQQSVKNGGHISRCPSSHVRN